MLLVCAAFLSLGFFVLENLLCLQRKKAKVDAAKEGNEAADSDDDDDDADDNAESD